MSLSLLEIREAAATAVFRAGRDPVALTSELSLVPDAADRRSIAAALVALGIPIAIVEASLARSLILQPPRAPAAQRALGFGALLGAVGIVLGVAVGAVRG